MTDSTVDPLVADYLERLNGAARGLPSDARWELLEEISEHIDSALAAGAGKDEASVRTLLDRLGEPEEIVASASDDAADYGRELGSSTAGSATTAPGVPNVAVESMRPSTSHETWAVLMLTVGSLIPVVGWVVGAILLWTSARWRVREKILGTIIVPLGPGLALLIGAIATTRTVCSSSSLSTSGGGLVQGPTVCSSSGPARWAMSLLLVAIVVGPLIVDVLLLSVAHKRVGREPDVLRIVGADVTGRIAAGSPLWGGKEVGAVVALSAGSLAVPFLGPAFGLMLAWSSPRWTHREKMTATVIAVAPAFVLVAVSIPMTLAGR